MIKGSRVEELPERISDLLERMREIERELASLKSAQALASAAELLKDQFEIGSSRVILAHVADGISGDDLRTMALDLRNRNPHSVVSLLSRNSDRVTLVVAVSDQARAEGVKAGALVKIGSAVLGGGGGGKDDFAQGGGTDATAIEKAIGEMRVALTAALVK